VLRLLAFVLPLGLDSFAVAAAIGAAQATSQEAGQMAGRWLRLRVSLVFVLFEGGMPLIGLALGARIAERWRELAEKGAGIVLILLGIYLATEQFLT
jgi:manganese efflux pump family protein